MPDLHMLVAMNTVPYMKPYDLDKAVRIPEVSMSEKCSGPGIVTILPLGFVNLDSKWNNELEPTDEVVSSDSIDISEKPVNVPTERRCLNILNDSLLQGIETFDIKMESEMSFRRNISACGWLTFLKEKTLIRRYAEVGSIQRQQSSGYNNNDQVNIAYEQQQRYQQAVKAQTSLMPQHSRNPEFANPQHNQRPPYGFYTEQDMHNHMTPQNHNAAAIYQMQHNMPANMVMRQQVEQVDLPPNAQQHVMQQYYEQANPAFYNQHPNHAIMFQQQANASKFLFR